MERTTRTHGHDSTTFRNEKNANNPMRLADAPDDAFDYDPQRLGLSNDAAPAQMKANLEEEQVQMKQKEPASAPRSAKASPGEKASSGRDELQMKPEEELQMKREDDEKKTQLKAENPTPHLGRTTAVQTKMPEAVQTKMQDSFGADFSNVNIHKDSASATNMGAQAYAQGNDIHFAPGKYNPNSQSGQELLGHELTHVVQQRQGRVQGTQNKVYPTKQSEGGGGANVNADPSLENEADVMGAKAAKGQPAMVNGKGSGVQKFPAEIPKTFEGLNVVGYGMGDADIDPLFGGHKVRLLLTGNATGWRNVLSKYADRYHNFDKYVLPFLSESGCSRYGIENPGASSMKYSNWKSEKTGGVSPDDKLEFMKALYDTDSSTKSEVDLANSIWEADANVMSFVNPQWEGLADFIKMNQHMIIEEKSKTTGQYFEDKDIQNLAEQGHTSGQVLANTPYVIEAMIQNAVATAINSVKSIIATEKEVTDEIQNYTDVTKYLDMIRNSALIANNAITQYSKSVTGLKKGAGAVFDELWDYIPFADVVVDAVSDQIKAALKEKMDDTLSVGGDYSDPKTMKKGIADEYDSAVSELNELSELKEGKYYINAFFLSQIKQVFRLFITQDV